MYMYFSLSAVLILENKDFTTVQVQLLWILEK